MSEQADDLATPPDPLLELKAMEEVHKVLGPLSPEGRNRVIAWAVSAMQLTATAPGIQPLQAKESPPPNSPQHNSVVGNGGAGTGKSPDNFATFADLFSAASPTTNPERALVGGYWLQMCQGVESFASMSVNNDLKNLGEGVENITSAFDSLKDGKPQLALQVRKDGKSQQARKKYKLTIAGIRVVERMIRGEGSDG
jgi:hypothetical protein